MQGKENRDEKYKEIKKKENKDRLKSDVLFLFATLNQV